MMGERYYPDGGSEQSGEQDGQGHTIEHTERGVRVSVKSKRGSGTRDQDTVKVTANYPSEEEAAQRVGALQTILEENLRATRQRRDPRVEEDNDE
jgi:hypothetical protein